MNEELDNITKLIEHPATELKAAMRTFEFCKKEVLSPFSIVVDIRTVEMLIKNILTSCPSERLQTIIRNRFIKAIMDSEVK